MKTKMTYEQKAINKAERQQARIAAKIAARIASERNQKPVASMTINIEWRKSRTWGNNPHATASVRYADGTSGQFEARCSGCGYDKESTVVANIFNQVLRYKLWRLTDEQIADNENKPYGISSYDNGRYFAGGIGMSCYPRIAEYIGGKLDHVASGKTFDVWQYTDIEVQS